MGEIKAIIFDMDGVLIDAKEWHYEALNRALTPFGHHINRLDHLATFDGLPTRRKLEILTLERGLPRSLHPTIRRLKQLYTEEIIGTACQPHVRQQAMLAGFLADGYRLALASNSVKATVELMMQKSLLAPFFEVMLNNQDVERPKPAPDIYQLAIHRLGLQPGQCMVIEDNQNGIKSAQAAGSLIMEVHSVDDVTYENVTAYVRRAERVS